MGNKSFKNGQQIISEGETNSGLYVIQSGRVLLSKTKGSDLVEIDELSKGDFLGLAAFCDNKLENTSATAIGDVSLIEVQKDNINKFKNDTRHNFFYKVIKFLASKLHSQNEKIKKLQYFNKLHFDKYNKDEMSLYHLKDILRMSWVLLLAFNRYNYSIAKDLFEDLCAVLISDFKIKPERIINLYIVSEVITEDEKTKNLSLIDADKLEFFAHFLLRNFIKNPRRLLLSKNHLKFLKHMVAQKDNKDLFQEDEFGFTHTFRHDLVNCSGTIQNASLILERLIDKGFFKKEFDSAGQTKLSFEFYTVEEILKCYEVIENFNPTPKSEKPEEKKKVAKASKVLKKK